MTVGHGVSAPVLHECVALFQHVSASIRGFHLARDGVCEGHLRDLIGVLCFLCAPVAERRAESMRHGVHIQAAEDCS